MSSSSNTEQTVGQTIALAGILQCAYLVDQIARTGNAPAESFNPSINSLFQFQADTPISVYGGVHGINLGLRVLNDLMTGNSAEEYKSTIRYSFGIVNLQKSAVSNEEMMTIIRNRLEHTSVKAEHFTDNMHDIANSCASIYQDTLSTLKYRIQVQGSMQQLQSTANANNIRALLLAGIRAATMWRQMGGRRWHLIVSRGRILKACKDLLAT